MAIGLTTWSYVKMDGPKNVLTLVKKQTENYLVPMCSTIRPDAGTQQQHCEKITGVQKLQNYDQMLRDHKQECRDFWLKEFPVLVVVGSTITFGATYAISRLPSAAEPTLPWWMMATIALAPALIVYAKFMLPPKSSTADVMRNRALRASFGMDSSVISGDHDL